MNSRTFQISVRATVALVAIATYVFVVRYVTYRLVLSNEPYKGWGSYDRYKGEIIEMPTLFNINTDFMYWVGGVLFGTIGIVVAAVLLIGVYFLLLWTGIGPKPLPTCNNSSCACVHCRATKQRSRDRSDFWLAAAAGAIIGSLISS